MPRRSSARVSARTVGLRRKVESAVSSPWQLYEFERRICPECTRSRGRGTRPHFRRIDGFRAREHGKDQIAVSASDLGEPGLAHPRELLADGRGQVMFHPLNRGIEVTLCHFQFACALGPHLARALLDSRGLASDLVSIDEDAAGSQVLEDVGEKMTLAAVG